MVPLVSVITPAYNAAGTLQRACDSLAIQPGRWQHIIVDDGSTDDTPSIIKRVAADPRVIPVRTPNRGPGAAHNIALQLAEGDFVAFLDADDEYLPGHIALHVEAMAKHPDVDLFWGGLEVVAGVPEDAYVPDVAAGFGFISLQECVVQGTLFVRRHVFDTAKFDEDRNIWYHDYEFVQRVKGRFNVRRFEETTYRYYRNSSASIVDKHKSAWPRQPL